MMSAGINQTRTIVEIGNEHEGSIDAALLMIEHAKKNHTVDVVKFQKCKHDPEEFSIDQHACMKNFCDQIGIEYACSVWDLTSAKEITYLQPAFIKIPAVCNENLLMLDWLCKHYENEIHISMKTASKKSIRLLVDFFEQRNRNQHLILDFLSTTEFETMSLSDVQNLSMLKRLEIKGISFSIDHPEFATDVLAYWLNASYVERHFSFKPAGDLKVQTLNQVIDKIRNLKAVGALFGNQQNSIGVSLI
jgi:sialic acid synthase